MVLPTKFLKQTRQLELTMTQMSQDCLKGLWFCKHAILDGNKTLVQDVSQMHEEVSEQGREAEQICMKILLLQHPVAKDLRRITVATNTIRDLTRIMDQEKEVSELICALNMEDLVVDDSIQQQFIIAKEMITLAIEGFIQKDEKAADQVIKMGEQDIASSTRQMTLVHISAASCALGFSGIFFLTKPATGIQKIMPSTATRA